MSQKTALLPKKTEIVVMPRIARADILDGVRMQDADSVEDAMKT